MGTLHIQLGPGWVETVKTAGNESSEQSLNHLLHSTGPFEGEWVEVEGGKRVRRSAIVAVEIAEGGATFHALES